MVAPKEDLVKKPRAPRKTVAKKDTTVESVAHMEEVNARHISENTKEIKSNSSMLHLLYGVIIVLMLIIAGLAFFVGANMGNNNNTSGIVAATPAEDIEVVVYDDARCTDCQTDEIVGQLESLPFLAGATFVRKDFSDAGVESYLKDNNVTLLPAITFNTNSISGGTQITDFLTALPDNNYTLALPSTFDPYATRSDKGFLQLGDNSEIVTAIKADGYIDGNLDAQITWIEYSDVQCPFCAKLHNEGTPEAIKAKYGDDINIVFQHFPLDFHAQAQKGAEGLECIAEQDESVLYPIIAQLYEKYPNQDMTIPGLIEIAGSNNINGEELQTCIDSGKYAEKVTSQMAIGQDAFGITGTPGNVLVNNATGEYEVISGAYPASAFEAVIDSMLK
ncbi:thioredoxin domain-containing protein [Candidatus Gracilibacteria bacterium]|nr:thioredoxin domain-containing protein [Candidatus Gracilibacteria bacterium]